jgi:ribosomal protein S27E
MLTCKTVDCQNKSVEFTALDIDLYCGLCGEKMTADD